MAESTAGDWADLAGHVVLVGLINPIVWAMVLLAVVATAWAGSTTGSQP